MMTKCTGKVVDKFRAEPLVDGTLDGDDVSVVPIEPTACDHCGQPATHYVMLDMRANGSQSAVSECCEACANDFANDLRRSLSR
jgi:DNA-directed RNA polymerase subunit M/transcription elongation factor TFIIS